MKKISSLALAAFITVAGSDVAQAQSSVTLFGILDAAISHYDAKSTFYTNNPFAVPPLLVPAGTTESQTALANSGYNSSRIGFRGTNDLGGGLAASFWLEAGIANETGLGTASGGAFVFNRRSTVSLSSDFGEIRLGRDETPTYRNDVVFDPFGVNGVGTSLISTIGSNLAVARGPGSPAAASDNYARTSNSVGYFLPPNLGGFYGQLMFALHENLKTSGVALTPSERGQYYGGRFGYANGSLDVALAYGQSTAFDGPVDPLVVNNKIKTLNLGASYDFGAVKLFGELSRVEDKRETLNPLLLVGARTTTSPEYNGGLVGLTVPLGSGLIRAAYSKVKFNNDVAPNPLLFSFTNFDSSAEKLALGYVHNLSKRTALYGTVAKIKIKDGQNNPAIMGATTGGGVSYLSTGGGVTGYAPRSSMGYNLGIRHSF